MARSSSSLKAAAVAVALALAALVGLVAVVGQAQTGAAALSLEETIRARLGEQAAQRLQGGQVQEEEQEESPNGDGAIGVDGTLAPTMGEKEPTTSAPTPEVLTCAPHKPCPVPFRCIVTNAETRSGFCKYVQAA